jgi:hypothetical protein
MSGAFGRRAAIRIGSTLGRGSARLFRLRRLPFPDLRRCPSISVFLLEGIL